MRKRAVIRIAVVAVIATVLAVGFRRWTRPIPFDMSAWQQGDAKLRFRMKDGLLAKRESGELTTRDAVDAVLGPDDDRSDAPGSRYFRLTAWYGAPWYLRITFDETGRVTRFIVAPD